MFTHMFGVEQRIDDRDGHKQRRHTRKILDTAVFQRYIVGQRQHNRAGQKQGVDKTHPHDQRTDVKYEIDYRMTIRKCVSHRLFPNLIFANKKAAIGRILSYHGHFLVITFSTNTSRLRFLITIGLLTYVM